jgi:hypothetical protein
MSAPVSTKLHLYKPIPVHPGASVFQMESNYTIEVSVIKKLERSRTADPSIFRKSQLGRE